jgi:hypothetical protein
MDAGARRAYAQRVTDAVAAIFPWPNFEKWPACARLLANARAASEWIKNLDLQTQDYPRFLNTVGTYLWERSRVDEAEPFHELGLAIAAKVRSVDSPVTVIALNNLAALYRDQERFAEAEPLFLRLKDIPEAKREDLGQVSSRHSVFA